MPRTRNLFRFRHTALALTGALAVGSAAASDDPQPAGMTRLDSVVVTGNRTERPLKDVPASISVIDARHLELRPPASNGDELAAVPGIVLRRDEAGMDNVVTVRGVPGRHNNDNFLVLVDGLPQMNMNGEAALDVIPPGVVQRVEVVKGPMSALYGRGGVSGAIHYLTLDPFRGGRNIVGIEAGSFGWLRPFATVGAVVSDRLAVVMSGSGIQTDGFVRGTDRKADSGFAKAAWRLAETSTLTGSLSHYRNRQRLAGTVPLDADANALGVPRRGRTQIPGARGERQSDIGSLTWEQGLAGDWQLKLAASHAKRRTSDVVGALQGADSSSGVIAWMGVDAADRNESAVVDAQLSGTVSNHRLVMGLTAERMRGRGNASVFGEPPDGVSDLFFTQFVDATNGTLLNPGTFDAAAALDFRSRSRVESVYLQDEIQLADRWSVTLGASHDKFFRAVDYVDTLFTPAGRVEGRGEHTSPKAAIAWKLSKSTTVYASFGEGFNPTFGPPIAFIARPQELKPEIARGYEIGAKGEVDRLFDYAVSLYRLDRKHLAEWILPVNGTGLAFANVGKQRSQGVEVESEWRLDALAKGLQAYINYAYADARWQAKNFVDPDTGTAFDFTGRRVPGVPAHTLALGASMPFGTGWLLYGGVEAAGDYRVDYDNRITKGDYQLWHAGLRWRAPSNGWQAQLLVRNLFDQQVLHYQADHNGPTEATRGEPRSVTFVASYRF